MKKIICFYDDTFLGRVVYIYSSSREFKNHKNIMIRSGAQVLNVLYNVDSLVIL